MNLLTRPVNLTLAAFLALLIFGPPTEAQAQVSDEQREEFVTRLSSYGQCNQGCAGGLATLIIDEGIDNGLAVSGLIKSGDAERLKGTGAILTIYQVFEMIRTSGGKIVDSYGVCAQKCDKLYKDIQELGSAGLLGPITSGKPIPADWFSNPKVKAVWDMHIRPIKASKLPAVFHNDARLKEIMNTA